MRPDDPGILVGVEPVRVLGAFMEIGQAGPDFELRPVLVQFLRDRVVDAQSSAWNHVPWCLLLAAQGIKMLPALEVLPDEMLQRANTEHIALDDFSFLPFL